MTADREFFVILSANIVVAGCSTLELAAQRMNVMNHDDGHVTAIHFTGLTQEQQDIVAHETLVRRDSKQMTGRKFAKAIGFAHKFKSRQTINEEWEAQDLASWQPDDSFGAQPVAAVEVVNEYTAIKLGKPSNLQALSRLLHASDDVVTMLLKHESIAPVNVHSHGPIIDDLLEMVRRAQVYAEAFKLEVQGR